MNYIKMPVVSIALFAAALMTGCFKDNGGEQPAGGGPKDGLTINLSVPGMAAMTRSWEENRIDTINVIVFEADGFVGNYMGTKIHSNKALTAFQYYIPGLELTGDFEIVAVANYPKVVAAAVVNAEQEHGENFTKEQFVEYLEFEEPYKRPTWYPSSEKLAIPMYGEAQWVGQFSPATQAVSVELTRALAYIEVKMNDSYPIEYISFRSLYYNGLLRPNYENRLEPNLPVPVRIGPSAYGKTPQGVVAIPDPMGIYVMETPAPTNNDIDGGFYIIVMIEYDGIDNHYCIDMTWDGSIPGTVKGERMPILRNYKYYVNINKVLGPGYSSWEEARKQGSSLNNLDYTIHVEDSGRFEKVAYDGSYMLGVEETSFDVSADEHIIPIKVSSNHPEYWSAKSDASWIEVSVVYDYYQTKWLENATSHSALGSLAIKVDKNTGGERTGTVTVTSGRLSIPITVKQSNKSAVSIEIIGADEYNSANQTYRLFWETYADDKKGILIKWTPIDAELKIEFDNNNFAGFIYASDSDRIVAGDSYTGGSALFNIRPNAITSGYNSTTFKLRLVNKTGAPAIEYSKFLELGQWVIIYQNS